MGALDAQQLGYMAVYVTVWSAHGLIVKNSQAKDGDGYAYNIWLVGLQIEACKLLLSLVWFVAREDKENPTLAHRAIDLYSKAGSATYFAVPAIIYTVANALSFVNMAALGLPTYRVLINSRILFSGLLLFIFFGKKLTNNQWVALGVLILACTTEQLGSFTLQGGVGGLITITAQALCSSLGGVYFQWLLQRDASATKSVGLVEKNIFLYSWQILANFVYLALFETQILMNRELMALNFTPDVVPIVLAAACGGFTTSLLLKHLDVVMKEYANAAEMVTLAVCSHYFFGTDLSPSLLAGMVLAILSVSIYNAEERRQTSRDSVRREEEKKEEDMELGTRTESSNSGISSPHSTTPAVAVGGDAAAHTIESLPSDPQQDAQDIYDSYMVQRYGRTDTLPNTQLG